MFEENSKLTRRGFITGLMVFFGVPFFGFAKTVLKTTKNLAKRIPMPDFGPINRTKLQPNTFSGDNPERAHSFFWKSQERKTQSLETPVEKKRLVVVGGGMSGLLSAHYLKKYNPVVLEQADRFGGNSKGESIEGAEYSIGAAYISLPDTDSVYGSLLRELGLTSQWKERNQEDPVELKGKKVKDFWEEGATPESLRVKKYLDTVFKSPDLIPEIPFRNNAQKKVLQNLDKTSLLSHLKDVAKGELPEPVLSFMENYCRSSFGGGVSEISAAAGLNFLAGEFNPICYFKGGNSAIAEQLVKTLYHSLPENSLRASALVTSVKVVTRGVEVTYLDETGKSFTLLSESAILSCPKFVVKHILEGIEPKRLKAIEEIEYRAYVVGNVVIQKHIPEDFYDLIFLSQKENGCITDLTFGGHSSDGKKTILTLYAPFAYTGGRTDLLSENYDAIKNKMESQLEKTILPLFNLKKADVEQLRITRWGHPVPIAKPGMISGATLEEVRKPFKDRVFFVEQDNWCLPAFETCVSEAHFYARKVAALLK